MTEVLPLVFAGIDFAHARLDERLRGLTDHEYRWEPVGGMWTVNEVDGVWQVEDEPEAPAPAPVTTIAWRLWHLASSCLADYATHLGPWPLAVQRLDWYPDAVSALAALDTAWTVFRERVHSLGEDGVRRPLGPAWGPYAQNSWAELVQHAADEVSHHGAEIALLRDLYPHLRST